MEPHVVPGSFVGRAHELEQLETALGAAYESRGSTVLITGESGIGKTRLVMELAGRARVRGATVLSGRCIDLAGAGLPYLPFVEALRTLRSSGEVVDELPRLIPELGGSTTSRPDDRAEARLWLFEEVLTVLEHVGNASPVVLILEDLHWADGSTLDLTAYLADAVVERPIVLLATYRSDEIPSERPVRRLAAELRRGGATVLELIPLDREELELLIGGAGLSADLTDEIYARSEGNPFFAEELVAAAARGEEQLPRILREVLLRRVAGLDATDRSVLRVASAAGRDVPYRLLAAVGPLPERELLEALRRAVEHELLTSDQSAGTFRFRHALLAEAVYATLLPGEREELHAQLARALAAESGRAAEIAHHWAGAGRTEEALAASVQAGREAERMSGFSEALRHLERAVELWPSVPSAMELTGLDLPAALAWAAELALLAGMGSRAVELIERAVELVGGEDPIRAAMLYLKLGSYLVSAEDPAGALAAKERAVELVPPEPPSPERAHALAGLARTLTLAWRHADSVPYCQEAIAMARATGASSAELEAVVTLGVDLCYLGRAEEGLEHLEAARRIWEQHGGARELLAVDVFGDRSDTLIMLGRLRDGARVALEGLARAARLGVERGVGTVLAANAAEALFGLGEWQRAREVTDRALRLARTFMRHTILLQGAALELGLGEFARARAHLEEAAAGALDSRIAYRYASLAGELVLWDDRLDEARDIIDRARPQVPPEAPFLLLELCALGLRVEAEQALLARLARDPAAAEEAAARAQRLLATARRVAGPAVAITPVAEGWQALVEAEYERSRGRARPDRWAAAACAWDQLEQPYRAAYCRWRQTEALVAAGASRTEAAGPARRAYEVCAQLGAQPFQHELELLARRARLDLVGPRAEEAHAAYGSPLGLTARESEVIQLLARGYTNREIASELTISVKTASVHVSHILRKLGLANRLEAGAVAQRLLAP